MELQPLFFTHDSDLLAAVAAHIEQVIDARIHVLSDDELVTFSTASNHEEPIALYTAPNDQFRPNETFFPHSRARSVGPNWIKSSPYSNCAVMFPESFVRDYAVALERAGNSPVFPADFMAAIRRKWLKRPDAPPKKSTRIDWSRPARHLF